MNWVEGIVVYILVWWVVIFAVLPWGVRPATEREVVPGEMRGAPARPRLLLKAGITTLVAFVIWLVIWFIVQSGWISFRGT